MTTTDGFTTCLWFDGQAEEAVDYYTSVFKNSERGEVSRCTEAGPGPVGSVLAADFELNGQKFTALNGGPEFKFNEAISFQIRCADQEEMDYYWDKLIKGGGEEGPCGWLKDRFGVSWQVFPEVLLQWVSDPDPARATRTTKAMLAMKKLDVAALKRAHDGA